MRQFCIYTNSRTDHSMKSRLPWSRDIDSRLRTCTAWPCVLLPLSVCIALSLSAVSCINSYIPRPKPEEKRSWLYEKCREPREFCGGQGSFRPAGPHCPIEHDKRSFVDSNQEIEYRTRAYRSRLKKWGVNKYKSRRKSSMAAPNKTSPSEERLFRSCCPPQTPEARLTLDPSLAVHSDWHGMFSTDSSTDEEK